MRRAVLYPLLCALALVTAVALLRASVVLGDASHQDSPVATEAAVGRFYAAINDVIRTGDLVDIEAAVAADFVDHAPAPGVAPDRAGLSRSLAALHATAPEAELVVEDVVAAGDRALARVTARGVDRRSFLGLPLGGAPAVWGAFEAFRVADGRVVERWGGGDGLALLEPFGQVALGATLPTHQIAALERLAIPPGGRVEQRLPDEARLIAVEEGTLSVAVDADAPEPALVMATGAAGGPAAVEPGGARTLAAGDLLALPPLTGYAFRNDTERTAIALAAVVRRPGVSSYGSQWCDSVNPDASPSCVAGANLSDQPDGHLGTASEVTVRRLAEGRTTPLPTGLLTMAIGRVTLGPGAVLPVPATPGPVLLSVEAGILGLETDQGTAWVRRDGTGPESEVAAGTLGAGTGALLPPGTAVTLRNAGDTPTAFLVVAILPADAAGTAP